MFTGFRMRVAMPALLAASVTMVSGPAWGQAGAICLFSDDAGTNCSFTDDAAKLMQFVVIHTGVAGATAVEFAAPIPSCMNGATWLGDEIAFPAHVGTSQNGISVAYGACLAGAVHILTIDVFTTGTTRGDCPYPVMQHPASGRLTAVNCDFDAVPIGGGTAYINSSLSCNCSPDAGPAVLSVDASDLYFGGTLWSRTFDVRNNGEGLLAWSVSANRSWIDVTPAQGTGNGVVTVMVDPSNLSPGDHFGLVTVVSNGGWATVRVAARAAENGNPLHPVLRLTPLAVDIPNHLNSGTFSVVNDGTGVLSWSASEGVPWLTVSPGSGLNNTVVSVTVNRAGLAPGGYSAPIAVASNAGTDTVTVNMKVPLPYPVLEVSPGSLSFGVGIGEGSISISNAGSETLTWNITPTQPWVTVTPTNGSDAQVVTVSVDSTGLMDGIHDADLQITSNGGNTNVTLHLAVMLPTPAFLAFSPTEKLHSFHILNTTDGAPWSVSTAEPWIEILPPQSGMGPAEVQVQVNTDLAPSGQPMGSLKVTSNGAEGEVKVRYRSRPSVPGVLRATGDPEGLNCEVYDVAGEMFTIYIVHTDTPGSIGLQFAAPKPSCMTDATYIGDTTNFPVSIGTSQTGMAVAYGACLAGPVVVMGINFFGSGMSEPCCEYPIAGDPKSASGKIEIVDCWQQIEIAGSLPAIVNPDATCPCGVRKSTWGGLRSLYADQDE